MIVDDHPIVRDGLRSVLHTQPDLQVVAEAGDGRTALAAVPRCRPDVVLMDLRMPGMDGVDTIRAMIGRHPGIRVVALTSLGDVDVRRAVRAGALGCLLKDITRDELFGAVRAAATGRPLPPPRVAERPADAAVLSVRELEVLSLVAQGLTNHSIARSLLISHSTVKSHLAHLFAKLEVGGRAAAVRVAIERGLLTVDRGA